MIDRLTRRGEMDPTTSTRRFNTPSSATSISSKSRRPSLDRLRGLHRHTSLVGAERFTSFRMRLD